MTHPTPDPLREALEWYADQFCELGSSHECCGRMSDDECSGCRARAALAAAPQPAIEGDPWQVLEQAEQPRLSDGYAAVVAVAAGIWLVLPLDKAKPDREALVEVIRAASSAWSGYELRGPTRAEAIADALLAAGYRKADALLAERDALIHDIERAKESESALLAELEQARGIVRQGSRVNSGSCQSRCHAPSGRNW